MEPEQVFREELTAKGQFSDSELTGEMLRQGKVLFLIDGLNEVDDGVQARWLGFARSYSAGHRFIFTSQNLYQGATEDAVIRIPNLPDEAVRQILRERADIVTEKLAELPVGTKSLLRNPANLLVVMRLLKEGHRIPETEYDLYRAVVQPLKDRWTQAGVLSYLEDLRISAASFAESARGDVLSDRSFPEEEELIRARLLVKKNGRLFFSSDRLAAFLVADALVEDPIAPTRMKPLLNSQWKMIMDMASQQIDLTGADALIGELMRSSSSNSNLAEYFVAALRKNSRWNMDKEWFEKTLLNVGLARQQIILRESESVSAGTKSSVTVSAG